VTIDDTRLRDAAAHLLDQARYVLALVLEPLAVRRRRIARLLPCTGGWVMEQGDRCVTVRPVADLVAHTVDELDCTCGPRVEWHDPDSGEPFDMPMVSHSALDGRD